MAVERWIRISELPDAAYDNNSYVVTEDTDGQDQVNYLHTLEEVAEKVFDDFAYILSELETTSKVPTGAVNEVLVGISGTRMFAGQTSGMSITFVSSVITADSTIRVYVDDITVSVRSISISAGSVTITVNKDCTVKAVIF